MVRDARRIVVLENVMNPTNVGAIFRSAAALGLDAVLLTRGCSDPLYRRAIRVSMGTVFQVPWTFIDETEKAYMELLCDLGFKTVSMALCEGSISIDSPALKEEDKLAILMGTEGDGLCDDCLLYTSGEETIKACQKNEVKNSMDLNSIWRSGKIVCG